MGNLKLKVTLVKPCGLSWTCACMEAEHPGVVALEITPQSF